MWRRGECIVVCICHSPVLLWAVRTQSPLRAERGAQGTYICRGWGGVRDQLSSVRCMHTHRYPMCLVQRPSAAAAAAASLALRSSFTCVAATPAASRARSRSPSAPPPPRTLSISRSTFAHAACTRPSPLTHHVLAAASVSSLHSSSAAWRRADSGSRRQRAPQCGHTKVRCSVSVCVCVCYGAGVCV